MKQPDDRFVMTVLIIGAVISLFAAYWAIEFIM